MKKKVKQKYNTANNGREESRAKNKTYNTSFHAWLNNQTTSPIY
jgi:hypothetical protein